MPELFTVWAGAMLAALLVGGWTNAWLIWCYKGEIRQWVVAALFPRSWLGTTSRKELVLFSSASFDNWLVQTGKNPLWLSSLLLCRFCLSAHIAGAGTLIAAGSGLSWWTLPFVWATGAALGLHYFPAPPVNLRIPIDNVIPKHTDA